MGTGFALCPSYESGLAQGITRETRFLFRGLETGFLWHYWTIPEPTERNPVSVLTGLERYKPHSSATLLNTFESVRNLC
jgi:hypothetical protein